MTEGSDQPIEFLKSFAGLNDPRQKANVLYPLEKILMLCLCAVISGADCWIEVSLYGRQGLAFLCRFLPFKHGVPSHDQLGIVFARLHAQQFQRLGEALHRGGARRGGDPTARRCVVLRIKSGAGSSTMPPAKFRFR